MNDIKIFENTEFGKVRVLEINGEPWMVATDICSCLAISNASQAVSRLDDDEKSTIILNDSSSNNRNTIVINESGMYSLVLSSRKPEAKAFKKWVTSEVLPSIRKTGFYSMNGIAQKMVANPQFMIEIIDELRKQVERAEKAEGTVAILTHVNKTYTVTEIAKELNMKSAIELNKKLAELHIQYKVNGTWVFYSKYSNLGYEEIKQEVLDSGRVVYHRKITQRGREFIIGAINKALEAVS